MGELGSFERPGDSVDLGYERRDLCPIETGWAALTDPARLGDWIGPVRVEPHKSGRYEVFMDCPRPMTGRILQGSGLRPDRVGAAGLARPSGAAGEPARWHAPALQMPRWRELRAVYLERYKLDGVMRDPPPGRGS